MAADAPSQGAAPPPSAGTGEPDTALPDAVVEQAVEWYVRLASGTETSDGHAAFARWHDAHPHHAEAWQRLQAMNGRLRRSTAHVAPTVTQAALARAGALKGRRGALKTLVWVGVGSAGLFLVQRELPWRSRLAGALADVRTAAGERRSLVLDDGTRLMLNTGTAVDLRFDSRERRIVLRDGEIMVATAGDPDGRPFIVATPDGTLVPLGTRFTVRHDGPPAARHSFTCVAVSEGAVQIRVQSGQHAPVRVEVGQQLDFDSQRVLASSAADEASQAWIQGTFSAEGMPLADFLAELSRYRPGILRCAPQASHLRITGSWPLDGPDATDRILDSLQRRLPVRVTRYTRYWVSVAPR